MQETTSDNTVDGRATYSVEDNKLRLYFDEWLDDDIFDRVKAAGFKWAPKQELFFSPSWSPEREDICIELVGSIEAEETTLVERAQVKAERFDSLAGCRAEEANAFHGAANALSERFYMGQPILVGHHSERKARKDQERIHSAMDKAVQASKTARYWGYRAEGVERHANRKSRPDVRARRIKTLLKELRDFQRGINHACICIGLWEKINNEPDPQVKAAKAKLYSDAQLKTGSAAPWFKDESLYQMLEENKKTVQEVIDICIEHHAKQANSEIKSRWIEHILNRLAYERSELGEVEYFSGDFKPAIIQTFVREHGAHSPKAKKDGDKWVLTSSAPLPLHIANSKELSLSETEWRELMQNCGYVVPAEKPKKPPVLNFKAAQVTGKMWSNFYTFEVLEMTKAEFQAIYKDYRGTSTSQCGGFRFRVCKNPNERGFSGSWVAVFLTDSKEHPAPESDYVVLENKEAS